MPAYDNDLQEQANYEKNMAHNEAREIERLEKQKINRAKYREYLCSPAWQMKREAVLERDQYLCQGCRCNKATDVHHKTYSHIYDELLFQLVAVCRPCHDRLHNDETP